MEAKIIEEFNDLKQEIISDDVRRLYSQIRPGPNLTGLPAFKDRAALAEIQRAMNKKRVRQKIAFHKRHYLFE